MKISRSSTNQIPRSTKERANKNPGHKSRSEYEAFRELQAMKTSTSSTDQIPRSNKKRKKNKKRKGHNTTPQKNKPSSSTLKPDILHKNKQTPLNILNGRFGGAVRCSRTEQTGASFGKGWWKTGSESATALKNSTSPIVSCSSTKPPNRQKCSDFYPELQDDSRSRTDSEPETAASEMLDDANVKKVLADDNGHRKSLAKCGYCGKESGEMKTCSRCRMRSYCDRACQARDFAAHKQLCKRSERFQKVLKGLPLECKAKINNLSFNVTPENDSMLLKSSILVEITERLYLFFFYAVMAVDLSGKKIFLNLKFPRNYKWPTSKGSNGPIATLTESVDQSINAPDFSHIVCTFIDLAAISIFSRNSQNMSEEGSGRKELTLEKLEKYKELRRCMLCKKRSFQEMVICPRCLEFTYCSQQCLQKDQKDHKRLCTIIGLKKGILEVVSDETCKLEKEIQQHARLLDDSGDMKVLKNTTSQEDQKEPKSSSREDKTEPKSSSREDKKEPKSSSREDKTDPKSSSREDKKEPKSSSREDKTEPKSSSREDKKEPKSSSREDKKEPKSSSREDKKEPKSSSREDKKEPKSSSREDKKEPKSSSTEDKKEPKSSSTEDKKDPKRPKMFSKENQKEALTKENQDIKKRNESSLPSGHFGEMLGACSQKDLSGQTFGDGWWKSKPHGRSKDESQMDKSSTASHVASEDHAEQAANSSPLVETQNTIPRENTRNESQVKEEDSPGQAKEDGPAGHSTPAEEVSGAVSGMELVPYKKDPNGENDDGDEDTMKWEKCFYCKKESYRMLKCSRCRAGRYCNKECQKKDFPQHKKQCARVGRFIDAIKKIPRNILFQSILGFGVPEISTSLDCLGSTIQHMLFGPRYSVLLEIVGPYYHPFRHGVNVMDRDGKTTHILFHDPFGVYYHQAGFFPLPIPLSACLKPGNFILLLDAHWHFFLDGTVGVRIDDLKDVRFILNSMN
ncbi:hypothetical protein BgiMline_032111 [Biomphalaria glabrata]